MSDNKKCLHCGMDLCWSDATERNGNTYCCRRCADETGCRC